jgi:hypothetical protein
MIAKILIEDKQIARVSYHPAYIPEDVNPYVVNPDEPLFDTINDYMLRINEMMDIPISFTVDGGEVVIGPAECPGHDLQSAL